MVAGGAAKKGEGGAVNWRELQVWQFVAYADT
jgi:hypothetical protein